MECENAKALGVPDTSANIWRKQEVDVVISTVAYPPFRDQLKIDDAIKVAGNIKRQLKFPITFVSANLYGSYFVNVLLRQSESQDDVVVYGSGATKEPQSLSEGSQSESQDDVVVYGSGATKGI
ncbi:hypothetical protein WN943_015275 [Citrus x changshan-huyou]